MVPYTFILPNEDVTVSAAFKKVKLTITHELTHLTCSRNAECHSHQVEYGDTAAITLVPDEGYTLPAATEIEITNANGDKITDWTINNQGTITITGGVTSDLTIKANGVAKVPVASVILDQTALSLTVGKTATLVATVTPAEADDKTMTWSSSDDTVATVDATGKVTAVAEGSAIITVTTEDGGKTATCMVTVAANVPQPTTHTVTFESNGGSAVEAQTVTEGEKAAKPADPTKTGYTFGGWYTDENCTTVYDFDTPVTANITLYAKWDAVVTPPAPSTPVTLPTSTETKENEDGTTTIIVTDNKTGTVTETTEQKDGSVEVVETKKDGSVTETVTAPDGSKTEKATDPDQNVVITVTDKEGEVLVKTELPAELPAPGTRFVDVPKGHWADEAIHNMAALEIVNGVGNNRFSMSSPMTRGMLATVLFRLSNGQKGLNISFSDVDSGKYYADAVAWAAKVGVVNGVSEKLFAPDNHITREQLATMLYRYAKLLGLDTTVDGSKLDSFNDKNSVHSYAADSMAWCVANGILNGVGNNTLAPTSLATRAQVALMLQRFVGLMK